MTRLSYQTNCWGGVVADPVGVTSIKDLFYLANGSTEDAMRDIAAAGYEGFELFDGNLMRFESQREGLRRLMAETGLSLVGVYTGGNYLFPEILGEELWRVRKTATLAADLGAEYLVVGGGAQRADGVSDDDYERLAAGLDRVIDIGSENGLTVCYHPHLTTIVETPEQLDRLMALSRIFLCPDTAHVTAGGGDAAEIIRKYPERVKYVHLKDVIVEPLEFLPLGRGSIDFTEVLKALSDIGYDDWITVELDSYAGPPEEAAEASKAYLEAL